MATDIDMDVCNYAIGISLSSQIGIGSILSLCPTKSAQWPNKTELDF
jgi:hypothetical protein